MFLYGIYCRFRMQTCTTNPGMPAHATARLLMMPCYARTRCERRVLFLKPRGMRIISKSPSYGADWEGFLFQDGAFMVRKSSGQDVLQPYTLVVFYSGRVYNIPIRCMPSIQQYALGREKKGEEVHLRAVQLAFSLILKKKKIPWCNMFCVLVHLGSYLHHLHENLMFYYLMT